MFASARTPRRPSLVHMVTTARRERSTPISTPAQSVTSTIARDSRRRQNVRPALRDNTAAARACEVRPVPAVPGTIARKALPLQLPPTESPATFANRATTALVAARRRSRVLQAPLPHRRASALFPNARRAVLGGTAVAAATPTTLALAPLGITVRAAQVLVPKMRARWVSFALEGPADGTVAPAERTQQGSANGAASRALLAATATTMRLARRAAATARTCAMEITPARGIAHSASTASKEQCTPPRRLVPPDALVTA